MSELRAARRPRECGSKGWPAAASALAHARVRLPLLLGPGVVVGLLMSAEFLFQPFIWRNYELLEIAQGWLAIARDRLVVALAIVLALAPAAAMRRSGPLRLFPHVLAAVLGATVGEGLLSLLGLSSDRQDLISVVGRILRWSLVGGAVAVMVAVWRTGTELSVAADEMRVRASEARRLAASSQLELLQRQIEPHFLFNTLATVRRLHATDPAEGQRLLGRLLEVMSATLGEHADRRSTLGEEVTLVGAYLDVCAARLDGRLTVRTEVPADLAATAFPPLLLATLAENAVKHGLFPRNGGSVVITAERFGDAMEVALTDDGAGLSGDGGGGLGLTNIAERLRLLYGADAELRLQPATPRGVRAAIRLPLAAA